MGSIFSAWRAWQERREILSEARTIALDAREKNKFKIKDQLVYAIAALDNEDRRRAIEIWDKLTADYGEDARKQPTALQLMIRLGRFQEAEATMGTGLRRHPNDPRYLEGLAQIAHAQYRHEEALGLYVRLRKRFPGVIGGYIFAADSLRALGRLDEAEALGREAATRFPDEIGGHLEYARIATLRREWPEAVRRWTIVLDKFDYFGAYVSAAAALCQRNQYDEAEALLTKARYRFGTKPDPLIEYARVAEAKGDTEEAIKRWKDVCWRYPLDLPVYSEVASALERLGESAEAVATLRAAIDRFPTELRPYLELAKLFHHGLRDFPAAIEAWAAMRAAFPEDQEAYSCGIEALRQAGREGEAIELANERDKRFMPTS